jgi:hypothetical protein
LVRGSSGWAKDVFDGAIVVVGREREVGLERGEGSGR